MALGRMEVTDGLLEELDRFEQLVRPLTTEEWETPSRCAGWSVGDVARHVIGSMADVVAGRLDGLGSPEVTQREVEERAGRSAAELADECAEVNKAAAGMLPMFDDDAWVAAAPGGFDGTLGDGVEALWYDTWLHGDDIRAALGRPSERGPGLRGSLSHVALMLQQHGWNGTTPNLDADPNADPGADAVRFILAATGRIDAATFGPGAPPNIYA